MRHPKLWLAILLVALLAGMAAKAWLVPSLSPHHAVANGEFDAFRAKARLKQLLGKQQPHPADSAANDAVRGRLVAQLTAMGLHPQVRDEFACNENYKSRGVSCARVRNVVATIGTTAGKHVLLAAHYDSTPVGPGAGDDGAGVATLLEVAYLLKDKPLQRPVTFLFDEGEELGLIGARAFVERDPLAGQIDSLLNFEARGVSGPVHMFETSQPNGAAIGAYAGAVNLKVANSLSTDVYRQMPNYTDVNTFDGRGWLTLNFAMIGNETRYHSAGDNLDAFSLGSLQHMGDQALALTTRLSAGAAPRASDQRIFMDVFGAGFVQMPQLLGVVLLGALLAGFAWLAFTRRALGRGLGSATASFVLSGGIAWLATWLMGLMRPGMYWRAEPVWTHMAVYACAILASLVVVATVGGKLDRTRLRAGYWLFFLGLGVIVAFVATGGIIFFLFPPAIYLIGALAAPRWKSAEQWGASAALAVLFLTFGEMLALLEELLNQGPMWLFAPLGFLLLYPALIEAQPLMRRLSRSWLAAAGVLLAALAWAIAFAVPAYSADRQQQFTIEYVKDANSGAALWSILNDRAPLPDAFGTIAEWSFGKLPYSERRRWLAEAPAAAVTPPAVEVIGSSTDGKTRRVRIRLATNGAESVLLLSKKDADISAAGAPRFVRPIDRTAEGQTAIRCFGRSCDGAVIDLAVGNHKPLQLWVLGWRPVLPAQARPLVAARPEFARPQYVADGTTTVEKLTL
jgi:hypothetical protein